MKSVLHTGFHALFFCLCPIIGLAQEEYPAIAPEAQQVELPAESDLTLTTHQAAVECVLALFVEEAGKRHRPVKNAVGNAFKAGLCTGKIQTYMTIAHEQNPACFPKISLEEGIRIFVNWAEVNKEQGGAHYLTGMKAAFEGSVPCLKK